MMNSRITQWRFQPCHFNELIKSLRELQQCPTMYVWVSIQVTFAIDQGLSRFIQIHSRGNLTWYLHIRPLGCIHQCLKGCVMFFCASQSSPFSVKQPTIQSCYNIILWSTIFASRFGCYQGYFQTMQKMHD